MNIREVEQCTGMKAANIRYYEKEGLLKPERNARNNYREYTQQDVERLNRIKLLRTLDVPLGQILDFQKEKLTLSEIMEEREEMLSKEIRNMEKRKEQCRKLKMRGGTFEELDASGLDLDSFYINRKKEDVEREKRIACLKGIENLMREGVAMMMPVYFFMRGLWRIAGRELPEGFSLFYAIAVVIAVVCWIGVRQKPSRL